MQVQPTTTVDSSAANRFTFVTPKVKREPPEVVQLHRVNLRTLIVKQRGLFVSVDYVKLDGKTRTLTGRLGVVSFLKGGKNNVEADERSYLTLFDVQLLQYRTVNLATVSEIRASRKIHQVID